MFLPLHPHQCCPNLKMVSESDKARDALKAEWKARVNMMCICVPVMHKQQAEIPGAFPIPETNQLT